MSLITDFNTMFIELATQISLVCPTSLIANNLDVLR